MKIGMRTIKTTMAVLLTIFLAETLNLQSPMLAGIAAIVTMQSNIINSLEKGKNRLLGTVFGAIVGLVFSLIAPGNLILAGVGMIVVITVCNVMQWEAATTIALIVFLSVMIAQDPGTKVDYAVNRTVDTLLGIIVATLINVLISRPDIEKRIITNCKSLLSECNERLREVFREKDLAKLEDIKLKLESIESDFAILQDESRLYLHKDKAEFENIKTIIELYKSLYIDLYAIYELDGINEQTNPAYEDVYRYHVKCAVDTLDRLNKLMAQQHYSTQV